MPISRDELIYGFKVSLTLCLAYFLAVRMGLPQPQWAGITSLIVMNPLSGAGVSKSVFRFFGTLLGAIIVLIVWNLYGLSQDLLILAIGLIIALGSFLSSLDGTPRGYVFLLAGYTVPIVLLPALANPATIFDQAFHRVFEISLGIFSAFVVDRILFPKMASTQVTSKVDGWLTDLDAWTIEGLAANANRTTLKVDRSRLAADAASLHTISLHAKYDPVQNGNLPAYFDRLQNVMLLLLPTLSGIIERLAYAKEEKIELPSGLNELFDETTMILSKKSTAPEVQSDLHRILKRLESLAPENAFGVSLIAKVKTLLELHIEVRGLHEYIKNPRTTLVPVPVFKLVDELVFRPYRDFRSALVFSCLGFLSFIIACTIWHFTAWTYGATFAMFSGVATLIYGSIENPDVAMKQATYALLGSVVLGGAMMYGVFPRVMNLEQLFGIFLIVYTFFGVWSTKNPLIGFVLINLPSFSGFQPQYTQTEFGTFVESSAALVAGFVLSLVLFRLTRLFTTPWVLSGLMSSSKKQFSLIAHDDQRIPASELVSRALNRLGQLASRLHSGDHDALANDVLRQIRMGLNALELRSASDSMAAEFRELCHRILLDIDLPIDNRELSQLPQTLKPRLKEAMILAANQIPLQPRAIDALVGLQIALFERSKLDSLQTEGREQLA